MLDVDFVLKPANSQQFIPKSRHIRRRTKESFFRNPQCSPERWTQQQWIWTTQSCQDGSKWVYSSTCVKSVPMRIPVHQCELPSVSIWLHQSQHTQFLSTFQFRHIHRQEPLHCFLLLGQKVCTQWRETKNYLVKPKRIRHRRTNTNRQQTDCQEQISGQTDDRQTC